MMKPKMRRIAEILSIPSSKGLLIGSLSLTMLAGSNIAVAQTEDPEEIVVTGIRQSLATALAEKRNADNLVEVIQAVDIGKLPDQNLAEVLENITGIQITREAGVGNAVQIRGTDDNRVEINGVSTVGDGAGRGGISFEDIPAALISSVEVTKSPEAKTIEGSVGGTINLRTLRPLELKDRVTSFRIQGEDSDLSVEDDITPRISGTYGDNWSTNAGDFGFVVSASYAEQDVTAFRPRVDRDGLVTPGSTGSAEDFPFLRIQFLDQDLDNFEFETTNFSGAFEWAPNDNVRLYTDFIYNDQERVEQSSRAQFSGVSAGSVINATDNQSFETVSLGSFNGEDGFRDLGEIEAVTSGILPADEIDNQSDLNPNLRTSTNAGARLTESTVFRFGGEWQSERLKFGAEISYSDSDTSSPELDTNLDFINPNSAQPGEFIELDDAGNIVFDDDGNPEIIVSEDNGVPVAFDLTGGDLTFGIAQGLATTPTIEQLLNPANYAVRDVDVSEDTVENDEAAIRFDISYDLEGLSSFFTSVEAGYRYNQTSSTNIARESDISFRSVSRPTGDTFLDILTEGPDNFDAADGRELFVGDFLVVDPSESFSDPDAVIGAFNDAINEFNAATGSSVSELGQPEVINGQFFDIEEDTSAIYAQANFEYGIFRGNFGFRFIDTDISSTGNLVDDDDQIVSTVIENSGYDFFLPRINVVANVSDSVVIRASYSEDINRPDFDDLSSSIEFDDNSNDNVEIGNPGLQPEEVESFDLSAEWYFAPSAVLSAGIFYKERTGVFTTQVDEPAANIDAAGNVNRDITDPCEDGGIFNPIADFGVNSQVTGGDTTGICVGSESIVNGDGSTTQQGIELAFQYDLSGFEDSLGWASGFGIIANYTYQEFDADDFLEVSGGPRDIFNTLDPFTSADLSNLTTENILLNLSENAYNITLFYEKYGISARARYTWRDSFRSDDDQFFGVDVVEESRGQLNASINYEINDNVTIGIEGINITQSDAEQSCISEGGLLCFQDLTDRRITFGATVSF